jgi:hypothetical protein
MMVRRPLCFDVVLFRCLVATKRICLSADRSLCCKCSGTCATPWPAIHHLVMIPVSWWAPRHFVLFREISRSFSLHKKSATSPPHRHLASRWRGEKLTR